MSQMSQVSQKFPLTHAAYNLPDARLSKLGMFAFFVKRVSQKCTFVVNDENRIFVVVKTLRQVVEDTASPVRSTWSTLE